jgi:hypothetical protein
MLCSLLLLLAQSPPQGEPALLESEHYRLVAWPPFAEGEEYLRLAEALYAQLERYFGARPSVTTRLEVRFWPDAQSYKRGGAADGIPEGPLSAGGLYWTGTQRAYFWRQPSANFTRHLFLHELTHQFQFLAVMDNQARAPAWYGEGLAEHFGYHRWDGTTLATGLDDVLGLEEDIPRLAEEGRAGRYDINAVVDGSAGADKPPAWAAVHYLLAGPDAQLTLRFHALEKSVWSGELAGRELAQAALGSDRESARAAANRWLSALKTSWKIEWIHWDARGAEIVGESPVVALVRSRAVFEQGACIEATLHEESGSAGLVLAFRSTADFLALYRRPSGRLELVQRTSDGWKNLAAADGPAGASVRLRAEVTRDGSVRATSAGRELLRVELGAQALRGAVGLFADAGRTRFSEVVLPPDPGR